jgi:purine nucleosidase
MELYDDMMMEDHASEAIKRIVNEHHKKGEKINIICVGPLTNMAIALTLDPSLAQKIGKFYCMGGTVHGKGNITLASEFNFVTDPEAAYKVINEMPMTHLLPWETAYNFQVTDEDKEILTNEEYPGCKLFKAINKINDEIDGRIYCCDGIATYSAIDPSSAVKTDKLYGRVELEGKSTRGSIMFNWYPLFVEDKSIPNVTVYYEIDHDKYISGLEAALKAAPK